MKEGFVSWRGGIGLSTRAPCWSAAHGGGDNFFRMTDDGFHSQMPLLFVLGLPRGSPYPSLLSLLLWQPADISDERHSSHRDTESQTWKNERGSISVQCRSREKPMLERGTRWFVEIRDHKQVQVKPLCSFFLVQLALICKKWVLHAWTFSAAHFLKSSQQSIWSFGLHAGKNNSLCCCSNTYMDVCLTYVCSLACYSEAKPRWKEVGADGLVNKVCYFRMADLFSYRQSTVASLNHDHKLP